MTTANDFPDILTAFRVRAGLSPTALALAVPCDRSAISRLENGDRHPRRDTVLALAAALRLSPADTDTLLISAAYLPTDPLSVIRDAPAVVAVYRLLHDPAVPDPVRRMVCMQLDLIGKQVEAMTLPVRMQRELNGTEAA